MAKYGIVHYPCPNTHCNVSCFEDSKEYGSNVSVHETSRLNKDKEVGFGPRNFQHNAAADNARKYSQKNLSEILLNQPKIRLYLPFFRKTEWHKKLYLPFIQKTVNGTKNCIYHLFKMVHTIWLRFDVIRFRKYFSVCTASTIDTFKAVLASLVNSHS